MKQTLLFVAILILIASGGLYFFMSEIKKENNSSLLPSSVSPNVNLNEATSKPSPVREIATGLSVPWAIAFLPNGDMFITEREGNVRLIRKNGMLESTPVSEISTVKQIGEGGLLGIALDPEFLTNSFVYLYYTYDGSGNNTKNRVVRMQYVDGKLTDEKIILDGIPGASNHDGGRIKFGPDGYLYIGTGDAQEPSQAQNKNTLAGKILRITREGKAAPGNTFDNEVYSMGHRNVQGLAWDVDGDLWATEHGRSGIQSGLDELNLIKAGKNYGWPDIEGNETASGMVSPKRNSGNTTWAPSGSAFVGNSLFFSGLRGQSLYEAIIQNGDIIDFKEHFVGKYGRIREVVVGTDGKLYITTSNTDGRGVPKTGDDKIIQIDPKSL